MQTPDEMAVRLLEAAGLQLRAAIELLQNTQASDERTADIGSPPDGDLCLTPRERQVLGLLGEGASNRRIATVLDISEHTVRAHLQAIFRKLGASQRTEAVILALRAGVFTEPQAG